MTVIGTPFFGSSYADDWDGSSGLYDYTVSVGSAVAGRTMIVAIIVDDGGSVAFNGALLDPAGTYETDADVIQTLTNSTILVSVDVPSGASGSLTFRVKFADDYRSTSIHGAVFTGIDIGSLVYANSTSDYLDLGASVPADEHLILLGGRHNLSGIPGSWSGVPDADITYDTETLGGSWATLNGYVEYTDGGDYSAITGGNFYRFIGFRVAEGGGGDPALELSLTAQETGADQFNGTLEVLNALALAGQETGSDDFTATLDVENELAFTAQETGSDTFAAALKAIAGLDLVAQESGSDVFAGELTRSVGLTLAAQESGSDTFALELAVANTLTLAAQESGSDFFRVVIGDIGEGSAGWPLRRRRRA